MLITFLEQAIQDVKHKRLTEKQLIHLGEAIRYYYYLEKDKEDNDEMKYFTLGYYILNFLK